MADNSGGTKSAANSDYIFQGSVLAAAAIISRIIGLLYRVPLNGILGDKGAGYYGTAYDIYTLMLLISSASLPLAVSKLVSARVSVGRIRDAYKIFRLSVIISFILGLIVCLITWFGADFIAGDIMKTPYAAYALRVLSPTLVVVAVLGVIRGFFQGLGTMIPSAISQVIEQIINAVVSILAAYILFDRGRLIGTLLGDPEGLAAAYGAEGGTIGTLAGVVVALIFVGFIYFIFRASFVRKSRKDRRSIDESVFTMSKMVLLTVLPVLLSTTLYNINSIVDQAVFKNVSLVQGYSSDQIDVWWGVFTGNFKVLINVPISIAAAMAASCVPALSGAFERDDIDRVNHEIGRGIRFVMFVAFPCTLGLFALSTPLMQLLFARNSVELAGSFMRAGVWCVPFYCLSSLSNGILQGINRMKKPVIHAIISLLAQLVFMMVLLYVFDLNIYALIHANTFFAVCMCILNAIAIMRATGYRQEMIDTFLKPFLASLLMGGVVYGVYFGVNYILGNTAASISAVIVGSLVYIIAIVLIKGADLELLSSIPGGRRLGSLLEKVGLMKE